MTSRANGILRHVSVVVGARASSSANRRSNRLE
jgi:hypothetical protein